jgi:hypothetical protein
LVPRFFYFLNFVDGWLGICGGYIGEGRKNLSLKKRKKVVNLPIGFTSGVSNGASDKYEVPKLIESEEFK